MNLQTEEECTDYALLIMPTVNQRMEWLSRAFLTSASAAAGFPVEFVQNDVFGVDATIKAPWGGVDWQLKATARPLINDTHLAFDVPAHTYATLSEPRNTGAYLGVVVVPRRIDKWVEVREKCLHLRHRGYWIRLTDMPESDNTTTVRVHIPVANVISPSSVSDIMAQERELVI